MSTIYVGQTALTIELDTKIDLTGQTAVKIAYRKPDDTEGTWTAAVSGAAEDGIIAYDVQTSDDLDQEGAWWIWADITWAGPVWAPGEPARMPVSAVGEHD